MANVTGFWCYVHEDDSANNGGVIALHDDLVAEYRGLTGDQIEIFLDREALAWGMKWRERRDSALTAGNFLVPLLSPLFFQSAECRHELTVFMHDAKELGVKDLVLPLMYIDVTGFEDGTTDDLLVMSIREFQWEDWRELRFAPRTSEAYRRGVNKLANLLMRANAQAETIDTTGRAAEIERLLVGETEDGPGYVDRVAGMEAALPAWVETIDELSNESNAYRALIEQATAEALEASS